MKPLFLFIALLVAFSAAMMSAHTQTLNGACSTNGVTAAPDPNGNSLKCVSGVWSPALSGQGTPTFKAVQVYVGSNSGWPAYQANFTMPSVSDVTSSYNASNGKFTAPVAGYYIFTFFVRGNQASASQLNDIQIQLNGSSNETFAPIDTQSFTTSSLWNSWGYAVVGYLNIGDYVTLNHPCCSASGTVSAWSGMFSGHYLHP